MKSEIIELENLFERLIGEYKESQVKLAVENFINSKGQTKKFNLENKILSINEMITKYHKDFNFIIHKIEKQTKSSRVSISEDVSVSTPAITFSQKIIAALQIEKDEKQLSLERMSNGSTDDLNKGQTRDFVAKQTGFGSGKQYEKAKFVYQNADKEFLEKLDSGLISIHKAYGIIHESKKNTTKDLKSSTE